MCRHIYDWNIVNCDVKQRIQLNSTQQNFVNLFQECIFRVVLKIGNDFFLNELCVNST